MTKGLRKKDAEQEVECEYRSKKYEKNMRDKGMKKVSVWVPEESRAQLLEYAEALREENAPDSL
jgi:hypothetical protein